MLYYLFKYLHEMFDMPGSGVFQYISFRAAMAVIFSLTISLIFGKRIISILQKRQVGETIRDLGLAGEKQKQGTAAVGSGDLLGHINVSLPNKHWRIKTLINLKLNTCSRLETSAS